MGFDDTSKLNDHALAEAFADVSPSAADPPARFSPNKQLITHEHPQNDVVIPAAVTDAMRLQALERFARRKDTDERTNSPLRKALVKEAKARSVCGTGVAERKSLGGATKAKIDLIINSGGRPETFGRQSGKDGIRNCADSIQGIHMRSGRFERPRSVDDFQNNDHASALRLFDDANLIAKKVDVENIQKLAPPAPKLQQDEGWSVAGSDGRPSMHSERESGYMEGWGGYPGTLGATGTSHALPDATANYETLPSVDPRDSAFAFDAVPETSTRPEPLMRQDTAFDSEILRQLNDAAAVAVGGSGKKGEGMGDGGPMSHDGDIIDSPSTSKNVDSSAVGMLDALCLAGAAVRSLSLEERKELFEVAVQEHVTALTNQLFPKEDGLHPKVHIDVAV